MTRLELIYTDSTTVQPLAVEEANEQIKRVRIGATEDENIG
jgi:hypothetical protein